jgi:PKD repeat protein
VRLTVTDDDGLSASDTLTATLSPANVGPVAVIRGPGQVVAGEQAHFDASESSDDAEITSFVWDVGLSDVAPVEGPTLDYTWEDWGNVALTLTVTDDEGEVDSATADLLVLARPTAVVIAPSEAVTGEEVDFSGTDSFDEDGVISDHSWAFPDDSSTASGVLASHVFSVPGDHEVSLTVTDDDGLTHTVLHKIVVTGPPNACPTAHIGYDAEHPDWFTGVGVALSAAGSTDGDGSVTGWVWDWGDGSEPELGETATHGYTDDGTYVVTLTVADDDGCTFDADDVNTATARTTTEIAVLNRAPVADLEVSPNPADPGATVTFDARGSSDADGTLVSYAINFDDGFATTGNLVDHAYAAPGEYDVSLTVRDDDDATDQVVVTVTVQDEGGGDDYTGTWFLVTETDPGPPVSYTCFGGFGAFDFSQLTVTDLGDTIHRDQLRDRQAGHHGGRLCPAALFYGQQLPARRRGV